MNRFQRSWQLFKSSLQVMGREPKLLLFPIVTAACTFLITLLFLAPVAFQPTGHSPLSAQHWQAVGNSLVKGSISVESGTSTDGHGHNSRHQFRGQIGNLKPVAAAYFAVLYFTSMFCATFFNVAFYKQILNALNQEPVSIVGGLRFACSKWKSILMWTLFAGAVGYVIRMLEERFGLVGRWVMRLLGTAWSVACVFVIPVMVTDEKSSNPLTMLKQSALTLTKTWGESLIGYAGVSFGGFLVMLLSLVWLAAGVAMSVALHLYWVTALMGLSWLVGIILWSYMLSVASQIFRCALFLYAAQGSLPAPYTREMMEMAWKVKKQ